MLLPEIFPLSLEPRGSSHSGASSASGLQPVRQSSGSRRSGSWSTRGPGDQGIRARPPSRATRRYARARITARSPTYLWRFSHRRTDHRGKGRASLVRSSDMVSARLLGPLAPAFKPFFSRARRHVMEPEGLRDGTSSRRRPTTEMETSWPQAGMYRHDKDRRARPQDVSPPLPSPTSRGPTIWVALEGRPRGAHRARSPKLRARTDSPSNDRLLEHCREREAVAGLFDPPSPGSGDRGGTGRPWTATPGQAPVNVGPWDDPPSCWSLTCPIPGALGVAGFRLERYLSKRVEAVPGGHPRAEAEGGARRG